MVSEALPALKGDMVSPLLLLETDAGTSTILRNEFHASRFQRGADGVNRALFQFVATFQPRDCIRRYISEPRKVADANA